MGAVKISHGGEWGKQQANGGKRGSSKGGALGEMAVGLWPRGGGWKHWE